MDVTAGGRVAGFMFVVIVVNDCGNDVIGGRVGRVVKAIPKELVDAAQVDRRFTRWHREQSSRVASKVAGERSGEPRRGHGWRRTARDEQLLQFATLHGMVLLRQASKWFYGGADSTASQRVSKMVAAGLLNRDDGVAEWAGMVLTPTRAGQQVGLQGLPPVFGRLVNRYLSVPDNLLHSALVADRMLVAQSQGFRVLTERQIRLLDGEDIDVVRDFLTSEAVGARFAAGEFDPGIAVGRVWRSRPGAPGEPKELVPGESVLGAAYPAVGQRADDPRPGSVRYPDFVQVNPSTGEMIAVEVEIASKANDRLAAIVDGYSKAVARLVPDGFGGYRSQTVEVTDPVTGESTTRTQPVLRRGQFRQVQWLCVPETAKQLRGRRTGDGKFRGGYIAKAMPDEYANVDWARQNRALPMLVDEVSADDTGIQYSLDQRVLHARYRCSYKRWKVWRTVWEDQISPERRGILTFVRWLMVPAGGGYQSNLDLCLQAESDAANAVPPRRVRG